MVEITYTQLVNYNTELRDAARSLLQVVEKTAKESFATSELSFLHDWKHADPIEYEAWAWLKRLMDNPPGGTP